MTATASALETGISPPASVKIAKVGDDQLGSVVAIDGDVFAHLVDDTLTEGPDARARLISVRGYFPLLQEFVQLRRERDDRTAVLGHMIRARQHRPLVALLLAHAMEPTLRQDAYLPLQEWARMLGSPARPCSRQASEALNALVHRRLVERTDRGGSAVKITLLQEDGSGEPWVQPGTGGDVGPGYFTVPHALFTDGLIDQLNLPGLVMLLVGLAMTNQTPVFSVPVEKARAWYGFSERTAERGYRELEAVGVMRSHRQMVRDPRSPIGLRPVHHRTLLGPYETQVRQDARKKARKGARRRAKAKR